MKIIVSTKMEEDQRVFSEIGGEKVHHIEFSALA